LKLPAASCQLKKKDNNKQQIQSIGYWYQSIIKPSTLA